MGPALRWAAPGRERPGLAIDPAYMSTRLASAANAFLSSQLLPLASDVYYLRATRAGPHVTADSCFMLGYGVPFNGATAQLRFHGDFDWADKRETSHLWVLGAPRDDRASSGVRRTWCYPRTS
jgi:hypothetical protein